MYLFKHLFIDICIILFRRKQMQMVVAKNVLDTTNNYILLNNSKQLKQIEIYCNKHT